MLYLKPEQMKYLSFSVEGNQNIEAEVTKLRSEVDNLTIGRDQLQAELKQLQTKLTGK